MDQGPDQCVPGDDAQAELLMAPMTSANSATAPQRESGLVRGALAALAVVLATVPGGTVAREQVSPRSLVLLLASDHPAYGPGMTAMFTLAVDNPTEAPITVTFPSAQTYDIAVLLDGTEVWRSSAGLAFAAALVERTFPPGVTLLGRERWAWLDTSGTPLPPGTYRVIGTLTTAPPQSGNTLEITLGVP
jgi:Intracellular proteinase inhibitor